MEEIFKSKYHRDEPIKKINKDQTMYNAVMNANENHMDTFYSNYFNSKKTFLQLKDETDKFATALKRDGTKEDEVVGVMLLTIPEVAPTLLAINKVGAMSYWMDITSKPNDLIEYIVKKKINKLVIIEGLVPLVKQLLPYVSLEKVVVIPETPFNQKQEFDNDIFVYYSDYINLENDKSITCVKYDRERPTIAVQSSGSTGKSKSILHTDYNFNSAIEKMAYTDMLLFRENKSFVCAPPWVIYGLVNSIYSGLLLGNETVFSLSPKEEMLYEHLGKYDFAYGVPVYIKYLYNKIIELKNSDKKEDMQELLSIYNRLDKVIAFISGGAKITEGDLIKWQQELRTPILNGYGNNESVGAAIVQPLFANKPGSIGIPMHGTLVKTFDINTGEMLKDGEKGEIAIHSDSLFKRYDGNEEETNRIKQEYDGKEWVKTGDIGYIDKDGYVYVEGRTKRLITDKLGYKISPDNSENLIQKLDYVEECAVVGVEIAKDDVIPVAFVELKDEYKNNEIIIEEVKEFAKNNLKDYECPKIFVEIEKIPHKSNGGKVDYLLLENLGKNHSKEYALTLSKRK